MKLTGKKFLLLILYAPTEKETYNIPISGRTRLMKMGFLFDKELRSDFEKDKSFDEIELPKYFAWKYGPFSVGLLNDLEFLKNQGYVEINIGNEAPLPAEQEEYEYWVEDIDSFELKEFEEEIFKLTEPKGINKALEIWDLLTENSKKLLIEFKKALNSASLERILEYVYKKYKDGYTDKSLIREKFI